MQIEPMEKADEFRCWLSESEQDLLKGHYADNLERDVAIRLMLSGLRSDEVTRVAKQDVRELDSDEEAYKLRIWESKTGYRECPISERLKTLIYALSSAQGARGGRADEPVVNVTTKTLSRWVDEACEAIADDTGDDDWREVSCHDLRRSWATSTYYKLFASPVALDLVRRWGGWSDAETFRKNYLGREPDDLAAELMHDAGLA
ncbi:site-specific integrase [Haloterrigena sp. H1]|uniref:site-specific integrase n=1 Tax=Haloterrigena sp. H1 TaxID=2552943 RepID=UPI00110E2BF4|nr:site-specific integrase [Haloterrigena sp. H1]TMT85816.1 site-specific integrase [Haloterrigena sp. H1]